MRSCSVAADLVARRRRRGLLNGVRAAYATRSTWTCRRLGGRAGSLRGKGATSRGFGMAAARDRRRLIPFDGPVLLAHLFSLVSDGSLISSAWAGGESSHSTRTLSVTAT